MKKLSLLFWSLGLVLGFVAGGSVSAAAASSAKDSYQFKKGVNISHWLSQNFGERTYGAPWFGEADVKWIAQQGFDHLRLPVDIRLCLKADGSLDDAKLKPIWQTIHWAKANKLGVVLDAHFLPGADFNSHGGDNRAFTDPVLMEKVAVIWRDLAKRFANEGDWLRFEILNEPVAKENAQLNPFMRKMLASIRESNPTRMVYVTSNRWSAFSTVPDVVLPDDAHIALTIHNYEPLIFTHQRASWTNFKENMPPIEFPGTLPDLTGTYDEGAHTKGLEAGRKLTVEEVQAAFQKVDDWVKRTRPGLEVYVGEFGVYRPAPSESKKRWLHTIVSECAKRGWGWAVWDYKGGFAVRDANGKGTDVLAGLFGK
ncbi:MAG TPA: cellulase family glycosylhydrolase [Opitutaceae bacterium]|nr:cellulase family glycosylhydrolase [Opitutaceae bacterium]